MRRRLVSLLSAALVAAAPGFSRADVPAFDGQRAHDLVRKQCAFGPRVPGSTAHDRCLEFMEGELREAGVTPVRQRFSWTLPGGKAPTGMTNLIARFDPGNSRRFLLCAHWDSRPWADQDPDSTKRSLPVPGANDGASGVAVLLELARHLKASPPPFGVDLVFFDGEDLGKPGHEEGFFRGSREYGRSVMGSAPPERALLLDMVGDADLMFWVEGNSFDAAPDMVRWVWEGGRETAPGFFTDQIGYVIQDDHLPLLAAGIPCIDLIDFHYPWWHTVADTPDKVSPASLQVTGDLLVHLLYRKGSAP